MSILKLLARTIVMFVCSVIRVIGVIAEGLLRISATSVNYLVKLDNKLEKKHVKRVKPKAKKIDIPV